MKRAYIISAVFFLVFAFFCLPLHTQSQSARSADQTTKQSQQNAQAWSKLKQVQNLGLVPVNLQGQGQQTKILFNMQKIKTALQKAGIKEQVTVQCAPMEGAVLGTIGTFIPDSQGSSPTQSLISKTSAPQAPAQNVHKFSNIPQVMQLQCIAPTSSSPGDPARTAQLLIPAGNFKLLFKGTNGETKASLTIQLQVIDKRQGVVGKKD